MAQSRSSATYEKVTVEETLKIENDKAFIGLNLPLAAVDKCVADLEKRMNEMRIASQNEKTSSEIKMTSLKGCYENMMANLRNRISILETESDQLKYQNTKLKEDLEASRTKLFQTQTELNFLVRNQTTLMNSKMHTSELAIQELKKNVDALENQLKAKDEEAKIAVKEAVREYQKAILSGSPESEEGSPILQRAPTLVPNTQMSEEKKEDSLQSQDPDLIPPSGQSDPGKNRATSPKPLFSDVEAGESQYHSAMDT